MFRLLFVSTIVGLAGLVWVRSPVQDQDGLKALQKKRIELLEQRVTIVQEMVKMGRASLMRLTQPEMDVINARLDYAETNAERKELLGQLLGKYDKLVEMAKVREMQGLAPKPGEEYEMNSPDADFLFLKSERVRVQILLEELE